jgi:hypothetical protein
MTARGRDQRPSLRLLVAASRLRHGQSPEDVAREMRLPTAFLMLMADELHRRDDPSQPPPRA